MNLVKDLIGISVIHASRRERNFSLLKEAARTENHFNTLMYVIDGRISMISGDKQFHAVKGDIVCYDTLSSIEKRPVRGYSFSYYLISFEMFSKEMQPIYLSDRGYPKKINCSVDGKILFLFQSIYNVFTSELASRECKCSVLALNLMMELEALNTDITDYKIELDKPIHYRIRQSMQFLIENYKGRHAIKDLAKRFGMHPSYFNHLFKKEVGVSPHQYLLEIKISKAKEFLINFNQPLVLTGIELGFHDYSHFNKTFNRIVGVTPQEFVRKNKQRYNPR